MSAEGVLADHETPSTSRTELHRKKVKLRLCDWPPVEQQYVLISASLINNLGIPFRTEIEPLLGNGACFCDMTVPPTSVVLSPTLRMSRVVRKIQAESRVPRRPSFQRPAHPTNARFESWPRSQSLHLVCMTACSPASRQAVSPGGGPRLPIRESEYNALYGTGRQWVVSPAAAWTIAQTAAAASRAGQGPVTHTRALRRTYEASPVCSAFPYRLLNVPSGKRSGLDHGNAGEC